MYVFVYRVKSIIELKILITNDDSCTSSKMLCIKEVFHSKWIVTLIQMKLENKQSTLLQTKDEIQIKLK